MGSGVLFHRGARFLPKARKFNQSRKTRSSDASSRTPWVIPQARGRARVVLPGPHREDLTEIGERQARGRGCRIEAAVEDLTCDGEERSGRGIGGRGPGAPHRLDDVEVDRGVDGAEEFDGARDAGGSGTTTGPEEFAADIGVALGGDEIEAAAEQFVGMLASHHRWARTLLGNDPTARRSATPAARTR